MNGVESQEMQYIFSAVLSGMAGVIFYNSYRTLGKKKTATIIAIFFLILTFFYIIQAIHIE